MTDRATAERLLAFRSMAQSIGDLKGNDDLWDKLIAPYANLSVPSVFVWNVGNIKEYIDDYTDEQLLATMVYLHCRIESEHVSDGYGTARKIVDDFINLHMVEAS